MAMHVSDGVAFAVTIAQALRGGEVEFGIHQRLNEMDCKR